MTPLEELHQLAKKLPPAYGRIAAQFDAKVKPVQDDVTKIAVHYVHEKFIHIETTNCERRTKGEAQQDLLYRLEVSRVSDKFVLCIGVYKQFSHKGGETLIERKPVDSMPFNIKMKTLEAIDDFVDGYVAHVKENRKALLRCDDGEARRGGAGQG